MNFTIEERLLLEQVFQHLEMHGGVRYHPHRRLLNQIMNDTVASSSGPTGRIPPERSQPAVAELAERLAKVEERQDEFEQRTVKALNEHSERFNLQMDLRLAQARDLNARIDKVAEIIGERISGLASQIAALESRAGYTDAVTGWELVQEGGVAVQTAPFPTGGASTAEAAADVALPVPQRGDRVRLEGAVAESGRSVPDGWYDVIGHSGGSDEPPSFQIEAATQFDFAQWVPWLYYDPKTLKEVRHADH